ncbi:Late embryogenesis abundant protein [Quillaja saponaria]|uniref:Late embryogenesis abundant protein n=1 Tax=Quillaja saponaria TaxID=32244 RepID=A0AAD7PYF5_QUISA|nr:Late embryogenesis abundant protein [Quillaja saponaria]
MAVQMLAKTDSDATIENFEDQSPPRSPSRAAYYVQSPSNHDAEKMSYASSTLASPTRDQPSTIVHSRESSSTSRFSSTSRLSVFNRNPRNNSAWLKLQQQEIEYEDHDHAIGHYSRNVRWFICFFLLFVALFTVFLVSLWGASRRYDPKVSVQGIVFENFNLQAGSDYTGVPTVLMSLNSTVKIFYRNPATFFGVHVTSTPLQFYYYQLRIASGQMHKFYQKKKSQRTITVVVQENEVPLYGAVLGGLGDAKDQKQKVVMPLNLTFVMRSRAHILGELVHTKFYQGIRCSVILRGKKLGKPLNLKNACIYERMTLPSKVQ